MPYFFKIKSMKEQNLSLFTENMNSSRSEKKRIHLYVFVCHTVFSTSLKLDYILTKFKDSLITIIR